MTDAELAFVKKRLDKLESMLEKHADEMEAVRLNQAENKIRYENLIREMGAIHNELSGIKKILFWTAAAFFGPFLAGAAAFIMSGGLNAVT